MASISTGRRQKVAILAYFFLLVLVSEKSYMTAKQTALAGAGKILPRTLQVPSAVIAFITQ